jgi:hypothetical protein
MDQRVVQTKADAVNDFGLRLKDAANRRMDWPSRERINHTQKINQRLGNPSITRHLASKGVYLRSRRTLGAWLVVERLIGSIARNGRITHPW